MPIVVNLLNGFYRFYNSSVTIPQSQFLSHINERAYRNHPLTAKHKEDNRERSQVRAKVEQVFGHWVNEMGGKLMGSIGKQSVKATLLVKNLV